MTGIMSSLIIIRAHKQPPDEYTLPMISRSGQYTIGEEMNTGWTAEMKPVGGPHNATPPPHPEG